MYRKTERVFISQQNVLLPLPPTTPPLTSPFPIQLTNGGTTNLATINLSQIPDCLRVDCGGVLLSAVINWSATFSPPATPSVLNVPGFADITFEFLTNGTVVYRVTQTAMQKGIPLIQPTFLFTVAVSTFEIASMLFLDTTPLCNSCHKLCNVYTLRATNISLVTPQTVTGGATTTAAVGAVTFVLDT